MRLDLAKLASRFRRPPVTRFAPSPTGYLHLGHVVNAIFVWGVARALGGHVILRIEDHDRIRSRPEFEAALLEDLDWLGFSADTGRQPLLRQSDDPGAYAHALARLRRTHAVYACACSRKDVGSERYPGTCRTRALPEVAGRGVRVRLEAGTECFEDALLGPHAQNPAEEYGDLLLRDRDGHWTYQLAVTVDDIRQDVTLVVRGADLLSSTGRQIRLARLLGRADPPVFLHHPIVCDASGRKLSKSDLATGVRELRAAGVAADEVVGRAAAAVDLLVEPRPLEAGRVHELFQ